MNTGIWEKQVKKIITFTQLPKESANPDLCDTDAVL